MKANLVFKDGHIVMVPVEGDRWPETINYKHYITSGPALLNESVNTADIIYHTITFHYVGAQYGVGAYVEQQA